jgi:hypothetical protein
VRRKRTVAQSKLFDRTKIYSDVVVVCNNAWNFLIGDPDSICSTGAATGQVSISSDLRHYA